MKNFWSHITEIPNYKKTKMMSDLQSTVDDMENKHSTNWQLYVNIDNVGMITSCFGITCCSYVGWIYDNESLQQHISYLTPTNTSPTSTSIVLETMDQSKKRRFTSTLHIGYIRSCNSKQK